MKRRTPLAALAAIALLICGLPMAGCLEDIIQADVPKEVQKVTGSPARVALSKMPELRGEYQDLIKSQVEEKATAAAAAAKMFTSTLRKTVARYSDQIAALQRQSDAEVASISEDAEANAVASKAALDKLQSDATRVLTRMDASEAAGQAKIARIDELVSGGLTTLAPVLSTVPGAGAAISVLGMLWALYRKKPGDAAAQAQALADLQAKHATELSAAKDTAYDQGVNETLARQGLQLVRPPLAPQPAPGTTTTTSSSTTTPPAPLAQAA